MAQKILVGGQAVIEGVMMRVPGAYATAVRRPDGEIEIKHEKFQSIAERIPIFKKPFLRGMISMFESLKIGLGTIQLSADIAMQAEVKDKPPTKAKEKLTTAITTIFAFGLAFLLFGFLPLWLTTRLLNIERQALLFNLVVGAWRILFFLIYLWLISLMKDIQRLFQYHGAEHKVVFTFESGRELTVENTRPFKTFHPRCGTSFIFIVMMVGILLFALIDALVIGTFGSISLATRLIYHLGLLPLVAGIGYEFLKLSARFQNRAFTRWLIAPGLWLQRITTKPPSDDQLEVAIAALKGAFGDRYAEFAGREYIAEAVD
ncbi:MAG: DUF1385 domain-containing protein [Candidatus Marinimicrobia bacterium]|jgi:uncharacterized protein YqhQ|nr:DUF1385 domain-containing protein [Candidatus Neomarinimicrobiota bacterium]MCK9559179.1 DUF1385 domain-containing protein [Candidatus Neomarinimicrobiota bacterium]MDD5539583.1 DUF1385 domain-containing protein [Candidatus Neomarinimicrobiota bacterium]